MESPGRSILSKEVEKIFDEMKILSDSGRKWWYGDPPLDEKVFETIHEAFHLLLYASGAFMDPRPVRRFVTSGFLIYHALITLVYAYFLFNTALGQMDDFVTASQTVHFGVLVFVSDTMLSTFTANRKHFIHIFRTLSENYFDYKDDFEIPEMKKEFETTRKQKIVILFLIPSYLAMTGVCCMMGRVIDSYFGRASNETYVNGVYMMTPTPMWYPFEIDNNFKHRLAVFSQVTGAGTLAITISGALAVIVLTCQSICLQFKILIYRVRKIEKCAYYLHRKNGGKKLSKKDLFDDPSFMNYFNICLNKNAEHHSILIDQFKHLNEISKWPTGIAVLLGSIMVAMSLLAFAAGGGKPSILALAALLIVAEVAFLVLLCGQSETVLELSESIHEELYNINWMDADASAKKTIMIIILRSKTPLFLNAGGLWALNWETFSAIMNTAYSYFNLVLAAEPEHSTKL